MAYITKDDFIKFSGIDLELEFKNGNYDIKDPVPLFIERVETGAINFLKKNYENYGFNDKVNANLEDFKKGMLWQVNFILEHGENYNKIGPEAKDIWTNIGLCNLPRFRSCYNG